MVWRDTTANVRKDLDPTGVVQCSLLVGVNSDAAGFQEIENDEHRQDIKTYLPDTEWWWNDASGHEDVQAFRKDQFRPATDKEVPAWASAFETLKMSDPMGVGVNPTRYASFSWMYRQFPSGGEAKFPTVWVDNHTVNGAFSTPGEVKEALRIPRFEQFMKNLNARLDRIQGLGTVSVILKGDWNATVDHLRHYLPEVNWLWDDGGIDNIGLLNAPGGHQVSLVEGGTYLVTNPSDHRQRTAVLNMSHDPSGLSKPGKR